jgi:hypothetical protein
MKVISKLQIRKKNKKSVSRKHIGSYQGIFLNEKIKVKKMLLNEEEFYKVSFILKDCSNMKNKEYSQKPRRLRELCII